MKLRSTRPAEVFSKEAEKTLKDYFWPGNIRELRNCVDRASIICREKEIDPEALFLQPSRKANRRGGFAIDEVMKWGDIEDLYLKWTLKQFEGNKTKAAEALGISVRGLRYKTNKECE